MKRKLLIVLFAMIILLSGCSVNSKSISSEELISSDLNDIDLLQVDRNQETFFSSDKDLIKSIYTSCSGIQMKKLSPTEENKLMKDIKALGSVIFISKHKPVGSLLLFKTGDIYMPDMLTATGKARTQSYIHVKLDKEKVDGIMKLLESIKSIE